MADQFDVSAEERKILEERTKRRAFLRNEFLKSRTDPFKHGDGGIVFDAAIQRYQAMKVTGFEHFKPSGKNALYGFLFMVLPMTTFGYFLNKSRTEREASLRRGEVAYGDRSFKFI